MNLLSPLSRVAVRPRCAALAALTVVLLLAAVPAQGRSETQTSIGGLGAEQFAGQALIVGHVLGATEVCLDVKDGGRKERTGRVDLWL